jgi:hypothetical protein
MAALAKPRQLSPRTTWMAGEMAGRLVATASTVCLLFDLHETRNPRANGCMAAFKFVIGGLLQRGWVVIRLSAHEDALETAAPQK